MFGPEYHSVCRSSAAMCLSQPYSFTCHGATPQSRTPYRSARGLSCRSFVFQQPRKPHDMIDVELAIQAKQAPVYVVLNSPFLPRDTHKSSAWSAASFAGQPTAASRQEDSCCLIDARSLVRNQLVDPNHGWRDSAVFLLNDLQ